jgi:hypothetical protein
VIIVRNDPSSRIPINGALVLPAVSSIDSHDFTSRESICHLLSGLPLDEAEAAELVIANGLHVCWVRPDLAIARNDDPLVLPGVSEPLLFGSVVRIALSEIDDVVSHKLERPWYRVTEVTINEEDQAASA